MDIATVLVPLAQAAPVIGGAIGSFVIGESAIGVPPQSPQIITSVLDWAIVSGDLLTDDGLDTAVAISLWTDRLANADDVLPAGNGDRRGWGGDAYLPPLSGGQPDHIGSRLWLLSRSLQILQTAQLAQTYCQEALQWMVDDGVAAVVNTPLPTFPRRGAMRIVNQIAQLSAAGGTINRQYESLWDMTRGAVSMSGIVLGGGV
jgi:phage gp46-like protein